VPDGAALAVAELEAEAVDTHAIEASELLAELRVLMATAEMGGEEDRLAADGVGKEVTEERPAGPLENVAELGRMRVSGVGNEDSKSIIGEPPPPAGLPELLLRRALRDGRCDATITRSPLPTPVP
jgi:hypothetical protein